MIFFLFLHVFGLLPFFLCWMFFFLLATSNAWGIRTMCLVPFIATDYEYVLFGLSYIIISGTSIGLNGNSWQVERLLHATSLGCKHICNLLV